ncbi:hypothetical protein AAIH70_30765 [Neorhizobium sp. BT27B]|uniref:hypothetical protein n=1 Tax=Neorhizobium sp. BT27B TaxID=3142625 RepID=UPI003D26B0C4
MTIRKLRIFLSHPADMAFYANEASRMVAVSNPRWERDHKANVSVETFRDIASNFDASGVQNATNRYFKDRYDIYLGLMGSKLGTPTSQFASGTVEEYRIAVQSMQNGGKVSALLFGFCEVPINPYLIDADELKKAKEFRDEMSRNQLSFTWSKSEDFFGTVSDQIDKVVAEVSKDPKWMVKGGIRYK